MTTLAEAHFGDFVAIIEPNEDRPGVNCYVTQYKIPESLRQGSSLAVVQDWGVIEEYSSMDGVAREVPQKIIDEITEWAEDNGY